MDTSEQYIKMCEKAVEVQQIWHPPNGACMPDYAFTNSGIVYKRSTKKGKGHFEVYDYSRENPGWLPDGRLGLILARHSSANSAGGNYTSWCGHYFDADDTFPAKEIIIDIETGRDVSDERWIPKEWCIWLPRQDQLQAMLKDVRFLGDAHTIGMCVWFANFVQDEFFRLGEMQMSNPSMEWLWLAFVMKELYGKAWDGEDWIAAKAVIDAQPQPR